MSRRSFLIASLLVVVAVSLYFYFDESKQLVLTEEIVSLPDLPSEFQGLRIVLLSDIHHGVFFPRSYVKEIVERTNALAPDIILLLGDYAYHNLRYIPAVMEELHELKPKIGIYAIQGNHDIRMSRALTSQELHRNGFQELTNANIVLERNGQKLYLAGVDDLQTGHPNLNTALKGCPQDAFVFLMSHHPDFIEEIRDARVRFVVAGHTHGGQIFLPFIGSPILPSHYGQKYRYGMVHGPQVNGYVTSGAGAVFPPIRFRCPPEIACLTLVNPLLPPPAPSVQ